MATFYLPSSEGYNTANNNYIKYRIKIEEGTLSGRTRPITVSVQFYRTNDYETQRSGKVYCKIAGTEYTQTFTDTSDNTISLNSYTTLFSKTVNVTYTDAGTVTIPVYAKWKCDEKTDDYYSEYQGDNISLTPIGPNEYTVTYNGNGGIYADSEIWVDPNKAVFNEDYYVYPNSNFFIKTGYRFTGWNEQPDGKGISWDAYVGKEWQWQYTHDTVLYAQWEPIAYNLIYNGNGSVHDVGEDYTEFAEQIFFDSEFAVRDNMFTAQSGYKFTGWNTLPDGTGFDWTPWINTTQKWTYDYDVNLYAQWTPVESGSAFAFVKINGVWIPHKPYVKNNGEWKEIINVKQY